MFVVHSRIAGLGYGLLSPWKTLMGAVRTAQLRLEDQWEKEHWSGVVTGDWQGKVIWHSGGRRLSGLTMSV